MDHAVSQAQPLLHQRLDLPPSDLALADDDVDIVLAEASPVTQCPAIGGTSTFQMTCTP